MAKGASGNSPRWNSLERDAFKLGRGREAFLEAMWNWMQRQNSYVLPDVLAQLKKDLDEQLESCCPASCVEFAQYRGEVDRIIRSSKPYDVYALRKAEEKAFEDLESSLSGRERDCLDIGIALVSCDERISSGHVEAVNEICMLGPDLGIPDTWLKQINQAMQAAVSTASNNRASTDLLIALHRSLCRFDSLLRELAEGKRSGEAQQSLSRRAAAKKKRMPSEPRAITPLEEKRWKRRHEENVSVAQIAQDENCSEEAVRKSLRNYKKKSEAIGMMVDGCASRSLNPRIVAEKLRKRTYHSSGPE